MTQFAIHLIPFTAIAFGVLLAIVLNRPRGYAKPTAQRFTVQKGTPTRSSRVSVIPMNMQNTCKIIQSSPTEAQ